MRGPVPVNDGNRDEIDVVAGDPLAEQISAPDEARKVGLYLCSYGCPSVGFSA
jgi:hypothetical protein